MARSWEVPIVGPVEVRFANRLTNCNAMILPGNAEILQPGQWPDRDPDPQPADPFDPEAFSAAGPCVALADRLVFAVPDVLPDGAFRLEAGCLLSPQQFTQVSLHFDSQQQLSRWELRRFAPEPLAESLKPAT